MAEGGRGGCHPSPEELDRFLLGEMTPGQAAPVVAHLLRGCVSCHERMAPLASVVFASGPLAPPAIPASEAEYDFPLFKAFASARAYAKSRRHGQAPDRRHRAFLREVAVPEAAVSGEGAGDPTRFCQALLERCRSLCAGDAEGMTLAASLAVTLAERLDANREGQPALADLKAQAWAELGNAQRVGDDLATAEASLARALQFAGEGTGEPRVLARIMDLTASLYTDQRRFAEAHRLLDWVYSIYWQVGDTHSAARALISRGLSLGAAFESEKAVAFLRQGILLADAAREPRLIFQAVHSLLWFLLDCGQVAEVERLLLVAKELYEVHAQGLVAPRAQWLEGRVAAGLGQDGRAEQAFLQVRESFRQARRPYDTALVSLDLAAVWLRQGKTAEVKDLVDEMVAIFQALNIQREAIGALLMLKTALRQDQATAALLQTVAAELRQLERAPARQGQM